MKKIVEIFEASREMWDAAVRILPNFTAYHLWAFSESVQSTYRHKPRRFAVIDESGSFSATVTVFEFSPLLIKREFVSLPFCDYGGILFADEESASLLLQHMLHICKDNPLILRQLVQLPVSKEACSIVTEKVRMLLPLEATEEEQFKVFGPKLRAQIRRPQKEEYTAKSGGQELLDDFYKVFVYNMRDLGSPVHHKKLILSILENFGSAAHLHVVYSNEKIPVACAVTIASGTTMINPWASSDRRYQKFAPNMLLYWEMISQAICGGFQFFDFGRSTEGEGTYRFKTQWGAKPNPMYWYRFPAEPVNNSAESVSWKKNLFIKVWQKLPLGFTVFAGPKVRRLIHL